MVTKVSNSSSSSSAVAIAAAFAGRRAARACDVCGNRSALWYCAADEAHLCRTCDTQVHAANAVSLRHERVRFSPNGLTPTKLFAASQLVPPSRKLSRGTGRPYSHHLRKLTRLSNQLVSQLDVDNKVEDSDSSLDSFAVQAELELFDCFLFDGGAFLHDDGNQDGNQEVPSLSSPCCSSDLSEFNSSDESGQEGDHATPASANSFAANVFKGKAAHSHNTSISDADDDSSDQFRVPDAVLADNTHNIDLAAGDDAFLFPGDIPGLDKVAFESFVPEMDLVDDDFSLRFDFALHNSLDAFEGYNNAGAATSDMTGVTLGPDSTTTPHHFLAGPFAKFFAARKSATDSLPMGPERIKRQARDMLQCCRDGDGDGDVAQQCVPKCVPSLELNVKDVLAAWSAREEPWICLPSATDDVDVGLVPDVDGADHRDERVLRYKEKRRTRLFSKTIRYEVRKLNAERRPRMKGRFVKRTTAESS